LNVKLEDPLTLTGYIVEDTEIYIATLTLWRATGIDGYIATGTYSIYSYRHEKFIAHVNTNIWKSLLVLFE